MQSPARPLQYMFTAALCGALGLMAVGCGDIVNEAPDAATQPDPDAPSDDAAPPPIDGSRAALHMFDCASDATARSDAIDQNFGSEPTLQTENRSGVEAISYLRFDPFAGGVRFDRIDYAFLTLTPEIDGFGYAVVEVLGPWEEETLTWRNKPSTSTQAVQPRRGLSTEVEFDITDLVRRWNDEPDSNFGLALVELDEFGEPVRFFSRESDMGAPRLELIVNSEVMTLPLSADAHVDQDQPNATFGGDPVLMYISGNSSEGYSRLLVQIDLSNVPPELELSRAELVLQQLDGSILNSGHTHVLEAPWSETSVTWNNIPPFNPEAFTRWYGSFTSGAQELRWDLTPAAAQWLQSPQTNYGVVIRDDYEGPAGASRIANVGSRENADPALRPRIELYYRNR